MSFIAGYLLGLSESGGSGSGERLFDRVAREPDINVIPIYGEWEIRIKLFSLDDERHFMYFKDSHGELKVSIEQKFKKLYFCVYRNGALMYGYSASCPMYDYLDSYNGPDDYYLSEKKETFFTGITSSMNVYDCRFLMLYNTFSYVTRTTCYDSSGAATVTEEATPAASVHTSGFNTSNIGCAAGENIAELTKAFQEACCLRYLSDREG